MRQLIFCFSCFVFAFFLVCLSLCLFVISLCVCCSCRGQTESNSHRFRYPSGDRKVDHRGDKVIIIVIPVLVVVMNALIIRSLFQFNARFKTGELGKHRSTLSSSTKTIQFQSHPTDEDIQVRLILSININQIIHLTSVNLIFQTARRRKFNGW